MTDTAAATTAATTTAATTDTATTAATTAAKPWFDGIDQETIGHWDNKGWKKDDPKALVTELTKAWKGLEKNFGVPAELLLKLPAKPDDEAGWRGVFERLGAPKEAKDYDFSTLKFSDGEGLDEGIPGFTDKMRSVLHGAGVAKDKAGGVVKAVVDVLDSIIKTDDTDRAATLQSERQALLKEWGTNFEFNRLTAMQGAKRLGVEPETVAKLEGELGYSKVMEMFRKIGAGTSEDTFVSTAQGGAHPTTMAGAKARLAELKADADFSKRYLAGDPKAVQEMNNLILITSEAA